MIKPTASDAGYSTRDVARTLELSEWRVRSFVQAGFIQPTRAARGHFRFSFQDLSLLRSARELGHGPLSARKVRLALSKLRSQLPPPQHLSSVQASRRSST